MDALIHLQSVTYTYPNRDTPALDSVDLSIEPGEFVLVSGPSGSGKSTVLRTINGLVPHFSGGVISGDIVVKDLPVIQAGPEIVSRHVGFVSQNPEAQAVLEKVEPEIAFALENAAVPRMEMHKRVNEVLDLLRLGALRSRAITTLSGGERQRVAIACALALKPEILVLDEPTSQLDPQSAGEVLQVLHDLNHKLGLTIVLAEHRLERVLPYADRLAYFEDGRLIAHDTVRRVLVHIPQLPPMVDLAKKLNWDPIPLTLGEAKMHVPAQAVEGKGGEAVEESGASLDSHHTDFLLKTQDLSFAYNREGLTLDRVDLHLQRGEILVVMGPNGSGKSTLLRCIVGLLQPSGGDVLLEGRSVLDLDTVDLARQIAYLPQYPDDLLFAETVYQELGITLQNHNNYSESRIDTALENLGLAGLEDDYPRDLSTGQRQRVALGAITITQPDILLLDEPTRGQDGQIKRQLMQIWQRWKAEGMALIVVTHDVELAVQLADRVMIMAEGKIETSGSVESVLANSPTFAPEIARLFPGSGWLTVDDAFDGLSKMQTERK